LPAPAAVKIQGSKDNAFRIALRTPVVARFLRKAGSEGDLSMSTAAPQPNPTWVDDARR
jgi:hypothetical protein